MSENPMADALRVQLLRSTEAQDSEVPTEQPAMFLSRGK